MIEGTKVLETTCGNLRQELERVESMNQDMKLQNQNLQNFVHGHNAIVVAMEIVCGTRVGKLQK